MKLLNVFVKIAKCICPMYELYLFKYQVEQVKEEGEASL